MGRTTESALIFCVPGETYKGKLEDQVAQEYKVMAMEEYDRFVSFNEDYIPFSQTPDFEIVVGKKYGKDLVLTIFADQIINRVGDIKAGFLSTSYLFTPRTEGGLLLPDLDVIEIEGFARGKVVADSIKKFYEDHGWNVLVPISLKGYGKTIVNLGLERDNASVTLLKPSDLIGFAEKHLGYHGDKLCTG